MDRLRHLSEPNPLEQADELSELALVLLDLDRFAEAESCLHQSLEKLERRPGNDVRKFYAQCLLGFALLGQKKNAEAELLLEASSGGLQRTYDYVVPIMKRRFVESLQSVARLYAAANEPEKAEAWRKKAAEFATIPSIEKQK